MGLIALITIGFIVIAYIGYSIVEATILQQARVRKRVASLTGEEKPVSEAQSTQPKDEPLPTIAGFINSQGFADKIMLILLRAGLKLRPSEFVGVSCGLGLGLGLAAGLLTRNIGVELLAILAGFAGPFIYAKSLEAKRLSMFNTQLPDALALIVSTIRTGYSFQRAIMMVSEEMPNPISEEFQRVLNEMNVGLPTDAAMQRMCSRIASYDLELVVTAVVIQQQIGGNLAEIIDTIANTIRERVRVEGEVNALTAEGRISGVVLILLPIVLAVVISIINPSYMKPLITEQWGIWMIVGGILLQIMGALVIKRMLVQDY